MGARARSCATPAGGPAAAALAAALVVASGCTKVDAAPDARDSTDEAARFEGSVPTLDDLGVHVLSALVRADTAALARVRLTEQEHNAVVWPELPASAPDLGFPLDYAWTNIQNRNARALGRILPIYRDRDLRFEGVECRGDQESFATYRVHTDCWILFELGPSGERFEAQVFQDALERGGGHKIFRYYDEEPRRRRSPSGG